MALDKVTYVDNGDGTLTETIVSKNIITKDKIPDLIIALQAQSNAFAVGRSDDPQTQADIDATIANTNNALTLLKAVPISAGAADAPA